MIDIPIESFLDQVEKEALEYPNVSLGEFNLFKDTIWACLNDPNANTSGCRISDDDEWIVCLGDGDPECTAENLSLAIQDGEPIEHFAGRVVMGI